MSIVNIITDTETYLLSLGVIAPLFSCLMIFLDAFISIFPYFILISVNCLILNPFIGFLISLISTILGSYTMYKLVKYKMEKFTNSDFKKNDLFIKLTLQLEKITIPSLIILYAIPYTPSFFVNIAIGLTKMKEKYFLIGLIIGKFFNVLFWSVLSLGLLDSIKNVKGLIIVVIILFITYISSKIYIKKFIMKER